MLQQNYITTYTKQYDEHRIKFLHDITPTLQGKKQCVETSHSTMQSCTIHISSRETKNRIIITSKKAGKVVKIVINNKLHTDKLPTNWNNGRLFNKSAFHYPCGSNYCRILIMNVSSARILGRIISKSRESICSGFCECWCI